MKLIMAIFRILFEYVILLWTLVNPAKRYAWEKIAGYQWQVIESKWNATLLSYAGYWDEMKRKNQGRGRHALPSVGLIQWLQKHHDLSNFWDYVNEIQQQEIQALQDQKETRQKFLSKKIAHN